MFPSESPRVPESIPRVNESIQVKHAPEPPPVACHHLPQASFHTSAPSVLRACVVRRASITMPVVTPEESSMSSPQEPRSALAAGAPSQAISKSEISLAMTALRFLSTFEGRTPRLEKLLIELGGVSDGIGRRPRWKRTSHADRDHRYR